MFLIVPPKRIMNSIEQRRARRTFLCFHFLGFFFPIHNRGQNLSNDVALISIWIYFPLNTDTKLIFCSLTSFQKILSIYRKNRIPNRS